MDIYKTVIEDAHIGIWDWNICHNTQHSNHFFKAMLGYSDDELLNSTFFQFMLAEDQQKARNNYYAHVHSLGSSPYDTELRYLHKNGSIVWVRSTGRVIEWTDNNEPLRMVGCHIDITEQKLIENELRESEQRWKFALEGTGDGLWDMNLMTNNSYHSKECKAMVGYFDDDPLVTRRDWEKNIHPEDREKHDTDLELYLTGKIAVYANEHRARCKDGTYKWILDRGKVIEWDENGKPIRMIGSHSDISERKEQEQQQKNTLTLITEQNNRLQNFAYIVSHNLRSHSGNFQMLLSMFSDPEITASDKDELLCFLKNASEKLNETIKNLNDVVNIQTNINLQKVNVNLHEYVSEIIKILSGDIDKYKVCIENKVNTAYHIDYNPAYLESILLNFITNAIKYRNPAVRPYILINSEKKDKHDVLTIADNGLGIDLTRHGNQLFGMYKTFHGDKDSRGIGLFITKNQVEAMNGHIEVESEVGKGTTFKIWLS